VSLHEALPANLGLSTYERMREMILRGELGTGTARPQTPMADRPGVSRTPVREAITRLVSDGLVVREAGLTPVVRRLTVDDFVEILHVRRLLEVEAAGRAAASGGSPALLALRQRFVAFRDGPAPDAESHVEADDRLHLGLVRLAGSKLLEGLVVDLRQKTRIFDTGRVPERLLPGAIEHIEIIDAVMAGDCEGAQAAMRRHIDNVRASVLRHLNRLG